MFTIDYSRDASDGAWVRAHTESLVQLGVLVPVEPCKHGFYVGHPVEVDGWTAHNEWCPGAGIGGDDEK